MGGSRRTRLFLKAALSRVTRGCRNRVKSEELHRAADLKWPKEEGLGRSGEPEIGAYQ